MEPGVDREMQTRPSLAIYVTEHCPICAYAHEVAERIRQNYPQVDLRVIDVALPHAVVPEVVFATPTYLLNGRVWSLGNPSDEKIMDTFGVSEPALETRG